MEDQRDVQQGNQTVGENEFVDESCVDLMGHFPDQSHVDSGQQAGTYQGDEAVWEAGRNPASLALRLHLRLSEGLADLNRISPPTSLDYTPDFSICN